jgi:hypothetical protein
MHFDCYFIFHPLVGKIIASFWSVSHMTLIIVVYFFLFLFEVYCLDCDEVTHPDNCTTTTACGYEKVCQNYISTKTQILHIMIRTHSYLQLNNSE